MLISQEVREIYTYSVANLIREHVTARLKRTEVNRSLEVTLLSGVLSICSCETEYCDCSDNNLLHNFHVFLSC